MYDLDKELKQFDKHLENARALAVLGYAQAGLAKQRYLRLKYVRHLERALPDGNIKISDIEGDPIEGNYDEPTPRALRPSFLPENPADYVEEERSRTSNISNHDYTEDMRLDDPRHTELQR